MDQGREKKLENAGKVLKEMIKNDSKPALLLKPAISKDSKYIENIISIKHEGKSPKRAVSNTPHNQSWNYPSQNFSFTEKRKPSPLRYKVPKISKKPSDLPLFKEKNRIKRVPPPNFMLAARDLHKVYENDPRLEASPKRIRNLSSIY